MRYSGGTGGKCFRKHARCTTGDCRFESDSALQRRCPIAAIPPFFAGLSGGAEVVRASALICPRRDRPGSQPGGDSECKWAEMLRAVGRAWVCGVDGETGGQGKEGSGSVKDWILTTVLAMLPTNEIRIIWTWIALLRSCRHRCRTVPWYTSGFT